MHISAYPTAGTPTIPSSRTGGESATAWQQVLADATATTSAPASASAPTAASGIGCFPSILGVTNRPDGAFHLEDLRARLPIALKEFDQKLRSALTAEGISTQPPFKLQALSDGKVGIVPSNDPRAQQVAAMMEKRPELADAFRELSSAESMLRAGDEAVAFQQAYERNPKEALARYGYLLDPWRNKHYPAFQLTVGPDQSLEGWEDGYTGMLT